MSHAKIILRALPNVDFVHGFPGIPPGPDRPHASIRGTVEVRLGDQPLKTKWVQVDFRKIETIPANNRAEEFADSVGQSPVIIWQAQNEDDTLSSKDFPFNIRVPETIPPSVALERGAGIRYEVVATLCTKGKKGLFRKESSLPISHTVPVVIDKHELHSTWPIYARPESRHVTDNGLTLIVDRANTCFAPGDRLTVVVTIKSDNLSPAVLRGFEFALIETITYRAGPQSQGKKNVSPIQTSTVGEHKHPVSVTLYGGTQYKAELGCMIPANHTTSSVNSARHIDITYSLNIRAILDMSNPVVMDLPITITNWPRHVSAEMIRRIGMAPNLSLIAASSSRPVSTLPSVMEPRLNHSYGPPRPPPEGGLPSLPNGGGSSGTFRPAPPRGALIDTTPASSSLSPVTNPLNPYSLQQTQYASSSLGSQQRSSVAPSSLIMSLAGGDTQTTNTSNIPNEFGYKRQPGIVHTSGPSRQNDKPDPGVVDGSLKSIPAGHQPSLSDLDAGSSNRMSQYTSDSVHTGMAVTSSSSTGRRNRATSRTFKIMNADIQEEMSPVKKQTPTKPFDETPQPVNVTSSSDALALPAGHWPTADQEKHRLYERAKARVEDVQARVRGWSEQAPQPQAVQSSLSTSSPRASSATSGRVDDDRRPRTVSPTPRTTPWPSAEEEKQRLFEQAQARVRQTQGLLNKSPSASASISHTARPSHQRAVSGSSSQDSQAPSTSHTTSSPPTISAGAALYSHAMASINRPASSITPFTPPKASVPRRSTSHTASSNTVSGSSTSPPTKQSNSTNDDKVALQYLEAKNAVQRRQREERQAAASVPQEGPIPYEELFRSHNRTPASGPSTGAVPPQLTSHNTVAIENQSPPATPPATNIQRSTSVRATASTNLATAVPEKEFLRRAFEARDAAIIRSGQSPAPPVTSAPQPSPPANLSTPPSARSSSFTGSPSSSNFQPQPRTQLSEKEQMRLAFEARDRFLATQQQQQHHHQQQVPPPPEYKSPISPDSPAALDGSPGGHLSAAEEKAQLKAHYASEDARAAMETQSLAEDPAATLQPPTDESRSPPTRELSLKSNTSETYLRRDPTISAGKKRASQMVVPPFPSPPTPPPPLPPRPPAEYIEETKLEDRRNTLLGSVMLPPSDFSSSFDLSFDSFGREVFTNSERRS